MEMKKMNEDLKGKALELVAALPQTESDVSDMVLKAAIFIRGARNALKENAKLREQLAAVTAERDAVLEDLKNCTNEAGRCQFCKSFDPRGQWPAQCKSRGMLHTDTCPDWDYRGPQGAGEGGE